MGTRVAMLKSPYIMFLNFIANPKSDKGGIHCQAILKMGIYLWNEYKCSFQCNMVKMIIPDIFDFFSHFSSK